MSFWRFPVTLVRTISCGKLVMAVVSQPSRLLAKFLIAWVRVPEETERPGLQTSTEAVIVTADSLQQTQSHIANCQTKLIITVSICAITWKDLVDAFEIKQPASWLCACPVRLTFSVFSCELKLSDRLIVIMGKSEQLSEGQGTSRIWKILSAYWKFQS